MPVLVPVSKAGEHKTIEQRERASRDARRWRNRGLLVGGAGAGWVGANVSEDFLDRPGLAQSLKQEWHRPEITGIGSEGRPTYGPRTRRARLASTRRLYGHSLSTEAKIGHGLAGGILVGGLGTAAALHGVNRYHQRKINQRRKTNLRSQKERAKENVGKLYSEYKELGPTREAPHDRRVLARLIRRKKAPKERYVEYRDDNGNRSVDWWSGDTLGDAKKVKRFSIGKSEYELVSKPFTGAQVRAIAAKKTREVGPEATQRYMHNLKKKTLKHHAQWGGPKVEKLCRTGLVDKRVYRRHREDRADQWLNEYYERGGPPPPPPSPPPKIPRSQRYDYEPGRQRRHGGATAVTGLGGAGLLGYGLKGSAKETWQGATKPIKEQPGKLRPRLIPKEWYRERYRSGANLKPMIIRAKGRHALALAGGGLLIAGSRKLARNARQNDREWY